MTTTIRDELEALLGPEMFSTLKEAALTYRSKQRSELGRCLGNREMSDTAEDRDAWQAYADQWEAGRRKADALCLIVGHPSDHS